MNYTVVGLFPHQEFANKISESLEQSGFQNQDYIIYKSGANVQVSEKANFWKKLLGLQKTPVNTASESFITSVAAKNEAELESIKKSFENNKVVKIYEFQDMTLEDAKNLDYIKKIVALRAKSQIYAMPEFSVSRAAMHEGITTEVRA